ncbi:MAG: hypothetical protein D6675_15935 [Gemmatimonadetes bacterium]|nr:MAG: hypothetical protein D6675_15935 [Gemmatimonadota bacterium]
MISTRSFSRTGIIEGFYGKPYSHPQRLDLLQFLAQQGMSEYIYAPKNDPYHRDQWRDPYPPVKIRQFRQLIQQAEHRGLTFTYALSPGLSINYASTTDRAHVVAKFRVLVDLGCRSLALLLDDISPDPATVDLAHRQIELVQYLIDRFEAVSWTICPTEYHGDGNSDYLRALGEGLSPEVSIFWTGPEICSPWITTDYWHSIARILHRPPLIWDNYPVNDASMTSRIHLRPLSQRSRDLPAAAGGFFANPMTQYEASKIPLMTIAAYCRDPQQYDAGKALDHALDALVPPAWKASMQKFIACSSWSCLTPRPAENLLVEITKMLKTPSSTSQLDRIAEVCAELRSTGDTILNLPHPKLRQELRGWAKRLIRWADFGNSVIDRLYPVWEDTGWEGLITRKAILREAQAQLLHLLSERTYTMAFDTLYEAAWQGIQNAVTYSE